MAFIRKVKTANGTTSVQIAHKEHGRIIRIEHIGSTHTKEELESLLLLARQHFSGDQLSLFVNPDSPLKINLKQSVSSLLLQILKERYCLLGFDQLKDDIFAYLCITR
jgi:hypothetical protein